MATTLLTCPECERIFDLMVEDDASEWYYGHDCEAPAKPALPLDRPPRLSRGGGTCGDCGFLVILFDDDEHFCDATGTSTTFHENDDYDPEGTN